jgi:hypothetical protein
MGGGGGWRHFVRVRTPPAAPSLLLSPHLTGQPRRASGALRARAASPKKLPPPPPPSPHPGFGALRTGRAGQVWVFWVGPGWAGPSRTGPVLTDPIRAVML